MLTLRQRQDFAALLRRSEPVIRPCLVGGSNVDAPLLQNDLLSGDRIFDTTRDQTRLAATGYRIPEFKRTAAIRSYPANDRQPGQLDKHLTTAAIVDLTPERA